MEQKYRMEGKADIPEEKRTEFNDYILKIFWLCGIRKRKEAELAGKKVTVVGTPGPDDYGIVRFDYSIFERRKRPVSFYNMKTCELSVNTCGSDEFGMVMQLVLMLMQEAGSRDFYSKCTDRDCETENPWFFRLIHRENEDEFLEFRDCGSLLLSDGMKENLEKWKQKYQKADEAEAAMICIEEYLADILLDLDRIWGCRYVDESLVREFTAHKKDIRYKKALLVFRELTDRDVEYFPELTAWQVREWVTRKHYSERDSIILGGYASMLVNHECRKQILGF